MSGNNPPGEKHCGWLEPGHADPHVPEERAASDVWTFSGWIAQFIGKVPKRSASIAQQSPNPESTAASSSAQDTQPVQSIEDPSPLIASTPEPNTVQCSNPDIASAERPDQKFVNERMTDAANAFARIGHVPAIAQHTVSVTNNLQSVSDTVDTFSVLLRPLKVFNSTVDVILDAHPYAKAVLSIFTCASKMILDQADRDDAVSSLLSKISEVYTFITKEEELPKIRSMLDIYMKIAQQTLECADFIVHYSEMKSFWGRLGKQVFNETGAAIQRYNEVLDNLMRHFRDQMALNTLLAVHRIDEKLDLSGMKCVDGVGRNTSKNCLPGTREDILSEIKCWIRSTGEDVPRVLWLSGTAGKGKSAIAHTIANWSHERGGMRACFCFDRTREAKRLHDKIFTTIALDLANCDIIMRGAVARAVDDDDELKRTVDISRQWQELVVGPVGEASKAITAPVLIIIDALDESGAPRSREQILRLLGGDPYTSSAQPSQLPANFRVIITSRPLEDIGDVLCTSSHVHHISMDKISIESAERDIQSYISTLLKGPHLAFDDEHFKRLAEKSDGLFEWARLVCELIKGANIYGLSPTDQFNAVIAGTCETGTRLLDELYTTILAGIMPDNRRKGSIPMFRSVMGQILASLEPLPMPVLTAMRLHFPDERGHYDMNLLMRKLGSLVSGTSDSHTPIRPLHASFYDFLTDESRSHEFFVDTSLVQSDLAFASLRVMKHELRFNICSLENSYLPNSAVLDLEKRVKDSISAELSYSCRFWGTHVAATSFEVTLAEEVEAFFNEERLLWWLEALALMKSLGGSVDSLFSIASLVAGHHEYTHIGYAARDILRFVRTFAATILRSTPHLYLSALPLAPTQSRIFRQFAAKFPCTPRIVAGHAINWPQIEKILHTEGEIWAVAMSPDGKRIACGSDDYRIQVWDTETGEESCAPLQGHTMCVTCVAFSPDGHRIASGSFDMTVRVWDIVTGKALGAPLLGHTKLVRSVAISSNGSHIVSGSGDTTIRVWDIGTGEPVGSPLEGHTGMITSVAISLNGNRLVSGSSDKTIRVWDMETGKALGIPLRGHTDIVRSVAISPNGKHIVSGSDDEMIRVWDMETGEAFGAPLQGHTAPVNSVTISSDGHRIVSGSHDQTIQVWDMKTGEAVGSPLEGHTKSIVSVVISPDGTRIVSGSADKTIRVWDADTITSEALVAALQSHTDSINSVAISPDGKCIVSGSSDETIRVWDMGTGKALTAPLEGHSDVVRSVAISSDGDRVVSGSDDATIRVWDVATGKALGTPLLGHDDIINSVAISLDGHRIVSGSDDKTVRVWDVEAGEALGDPLKGHSMTVWSVAISSDGNSIVSCSDDKTIQVWDMGTGKASSIPLEGHTDFVRSVTISPDGYYIASGLEDGTVQVWDMETSELWAKALPGHFAPVTSVAISPDGECVVSGSDDWTIQVWDMDTGEAVCALHGHTGFIQSVAISPDGKRIVSGSIDKTIRVWDIEFLNQDHHSIPAPPICFSPNPIYTLHSASSFLQGSTPDPVYLNEDGWVVGPEAQLLLWIPINCYPAMYFPGNTLVIHDRPSQLDLRYFAHGTSWHLCREPKAALFS